TRRRAAARARDARARQGWATFPRASHPTQHGWVTFPRAPLRPRLRGPSMVTHGSRQESLVGSPRTRAVSDLFDVLDTDHGGVLSAQELLDLTYIRGLDITNWVEEWNGIVCDIGTDHANGKEGLGFEKFKQLVAAGKYPRQLEKESREEISTKMDVVRMPH
ncbi:unnamed protein product, partial [Prorocentrum cordatum]